MAKIIYVPKFTVEGGSGYKLYTYAAGTSTPKTTWADSTELSANSNPVILDSAGQATLYGSGSYKFVLKTDADVTVWTVDNVTVAGYVETGDIVDGAVTTAKLATGVLSADTTGRSKMADGYITSAKLNSAGVALPNGSTATTQSASDNTTKVATTAYVTNEIVATRKILQSKTYTYTTASTTTNTILIDGSIPQISEGDQIFSQSFTPISASSIIRVTLVGNFGNSGNYTTVAMFKDSTADAIAATCVTVANNGGVSSCELVYSETSGSTTARTYSVRYGGAVAATTASVNQSQNGNHYGSGIMQCKLLIDEYTA